MPGAKKGAHYSGLALMALWALAAAPAPGAPQHPEADARKAEADLREVKSEIERVTRQVSEEQVERDRLTQELRSAELSVGKARLSLGDIRR